MQALCVYQNPNFSPHCSLTILMPPSVNTLSSDRNKKSTTLPPMRYSRRDDFRFLTGGRTLGVVPVAVLFWGVFATHFFKLDIIWECS
jgi:hypothetical protein